MNSKNRLFINSFACLLFLIFLISCDKKPSNGEINRKKKHLRLVAEYSISEPLKRFQLNPYERGFLAYQFSKKQIVHMDESFKIVKRMGSEGDAPYENRMILNYQILDKDWIAIFDTEKNTFKIQNWQDSVQKFFKFPEKFERGVLVNDSLIVYTFFDSDDVRMRFATRLVNENYQFQLVKQLNLLIDEPLSGFIYEGNLAKSDDYIYNFSGLYTEFLRLNYHTMKSEKLNYGVYKNFQKPEIISIAGGYFSANNPEITRHATISQGKIFVLSNVSNSDFGNNKVIDVYRELDFEYQYSYTLENLMDFSPLEIFVSENEIYLAQDQKVLVLVEDKDRAMK